MHIAYKPLNIQEKKLRIIGTVLFHTFHSNATNNKGHLVNIEYIFENNGQTPKTVFFFTWNIGK